MGSDLEQDAATEAGPKRASKEILRHEIAEALDALDRSVSRLFMSGLSAGLDVGFSLFLMAAVRTMGDGRLSPAVVDLLVANMYSFGFILVVLGRSELFTEQTSLAVLPVLSGQASVGALARLWSVVYVANLTGAAAFAGLTVLIGPGLGVIAPQALGTIAHGLVAHSGQMIFLSAMMAGWLMGLLSWLVAAGRDTISQIVIIWLITTAIGLGHFHHVVVGSVEVLAGVFSGEGARFADFWRFLLWATLGNALGGSVFVALLKYGLARPSQHEGHE